MMNSTKKALLIAVLSLAGATGIATGFITVYVKEDKAVSEVKTVSETQKIDRVADVKTVDWYSEHKEERDRLLRECNNNPGQLRRDPNCVNAMQSMNNDTGGNLEDYNNW